VRSGQPQCAFIEILLQLMSSRTMRFSKSALLAAFFIDPSPSDAQTSTRVTRQDTVCEAAASAVKVGDRSPEGKRKLVRLGACGRVAVPAVAVAFRDARAVRDTAYLIQLMSFLDLWPESELLGATLDVAEDPAASLEARVVALMGIFRLSAPLMVANYEELTHAIDAQGRHVAQCSSGMIAGGETKSRLAESAQNRVGAAMRRIVRDSRAPAEVRSAAWCVGW
jgi:hypothetical protein